MLSSVSAEEKPGSLLNPMICSYTDASGSVPVLIQAQTYTGLDGDGLPVASNVMGVSAQIPALSQCNIDAGCVGGNFECFLTREACIEQLECTQLETGTVFPEVTRLQGMTRADGKFGGVFLTTASGTTKLLGKEYDDPMTLVFVSAPIIGIDIWYDDTSINGISIIGDECVCRFHEF